MQENQSFSLVPTNLSEAKELATLISNSDMVPKDYRGKAGNVLVAIQMGQELGLPPMQAIQNIAVINGRPSIWGDAMLALVRSNPACEWVKETIEGSGDKMVAVCAIKRKGDPEPTERRFSVEDSKQAGLWNKDGPWKAYPKRMLQMRARSWACRDCFPDALRGISMAEEQQDVKDMGSADVVSKTPMPQPIKPVSTAPDMEPPLPADGGEPGLPDDDEPTQPPMSEAMAASPVAAPEGDPIVSGAIRIVAMKMASAGKTEKDLKEKFGAAEIKDLKQSQVNDVLAWCKS